MLERALRVRIPTRAQLGKAVTVAVELDPESQGTVHSAVMSLRCEQIGSAGRPAAILWQEQGRSGRRSGRRLEASVTLPRNLQPSYRGHLAEIRYRASVSARWVDDDGLERVVEQSSAVEVMPIRPRRVDRGGRRDSIAIGRGRSLEIELERRRLARGERLRGRFAVQGLPPSRIRQVQVALVATETLLAARGRPAVRSELFLLHGENHAVAESNRWMPFELGVPRAFPPTVHGPLIAVYAELRFHVEVSWGLDARAEVPVVIDDETLLPAADPAPRQWLELAEATRFARQDGELVGDIGAVRARVQLVERRRKPALLAAQLRYPNLRLGIKLHRDPMDLGGMVVDRGRDAQQVKAFAAAVRPAADVFDVLALDDERAYAALTLRERPEHVVREFLSAVARLARQIEGGRRAVPPPASLAGSVGRWQSLARALEGRLDLPSMSIAGQWKGMSVQIDTGYGPSGEPVSTALRLRVPWPLAGPHHLSTSADIDALPPGLRAGARSCLVDGHHLEIRDTELVLVTGALFEQLDIALEQLGRLEELAHALRASPAYR